MVNEAGPCKEGGWDIGRWAHEEKIQSGNDEKGEKFPEPLPRVAHLHHILDFLRT